MNVLELLGLWKLLDAANGRFGNPIRQMTTSDCAYEHQELSFPVGRGDPAEALSVVFTDDPAIIYLITTFAQERYSRPARDFVVSR